MGFVDRSLALDEPSLPQSRNSSVVQASKGGVDLLKDTSKSHTASYGTDPTKPHMLEHIPTDLQPMTARWPGRSPWGAWLLGLVLMLLGSFGPLNVVSAGCSSEGISHARIFQSRSVPGGQLALELYVRYERGSIGFTLERPGRPCEGPECGTKSSVEPTMLIPVGQRLLVSGTAISESRVLASDASRLDYSLPASLYAPRGSLEACEPPPKASI